jgi:hypothetical protein
VTSLFDVDIGDWVLWVVKGRSFVDVEI